MQPRERVLTALARAEPDRVPYCELGIDRALAQALMGWGAPTTHAASLEANNYSVDEAKALAAHLALDNLTYTMRAPVYAQRVAGQDGRLFYGEGLIRSAAELPLLQLPDPHDPALYTEAAHFVAEKGPYCLWFVTRIGIFPTWLSMGAEPFSLALYDNRPLVEEILDRYCDWARVVAERVCGMGFDVYASTDDMAFRTAPFFSPKVFRELVLPRMRRVAEKITIPWILHSDGNILPFLDDLVDLGIAGLHPVEKGAMDIRAIKQRYGDRICVLGNVDLNILGLGTPADVRAEVRGLIQDLAPGGGYVVTSGNSLAAYVRVENALALSAAVQEYGRYSLPV